jgi:Spy/CpxP family protein refolding chaperone
MKTKFLPLILVLLVSLNAILIFILLKKPNQNQFKPKGKDFLVTQLNFTEKQKEAFFVLDENHRKKMTSVDREVRITKDNLFKSLKDNTINEEIILENLGRSVSKREKEILTFFKSVRKLCTSEQAEKFDEIIEKALKNGPHRPPHEMRPPPPRRDF